MEGGHSGTLDVLTKEDRANDLDRGVRDWLCPPVEGGIE
jgi:hypothetical protein